MDSEIQIDTPARSRLLGVPVDMVDMQSSLQHIDRMLHSDRLHTILAVNPEKIIATQENEILREALENASLVIPDGIGVVLASRMMKLGQLDRVAGADLMPAICNLAADRKKSVFLYGAKPGVATRAAELLAERFTGLTVAGTSDGYVPENEIDRLVDTINGSGASVLFVGLGSPRQELWMQTHRHHLESIRVCQGVGGTFDAICGNPPRAPKLVQRLYLEWAWRLIKQPDRLLRQTALPRFIAQVIRHTLASQ